MTDDSKTYTQAELDAAVAAERIRIRNRLTQLGLTFWWPRQTDGSGWPIAELFDGMAAKV